MSCTGRPTPCWPRLIPIVCVGENLQQNEPARRRRSSVDRCGRARPPVAQQIAGLVVAHSRSGRLAPAGAQRRR
jgi:hypothetical protein